MHLLVELSLSVVLLSHILFCISLLRHLGRVKEWGRTGLEIDFRQVS